MYDQLTLLGEQLKRQPRHVLLAAAAMAACVALAAAFLVGGICGFGLLRLLIAAEVRAERAAEVGNDPAVGGRRQWLEASTVQREKAIERFVHQRHPGLKGMELNFRTGFIYGRMEAIYEQQTMAQLMAMADDMYGDQFGK